MRPVRAAGLGRRKAVDTFQNRHARPFYAILQPGG
jgi:hypothetical protein